ncbi:MAG: hypothetical protein J0M15_06805 [Deltaproteobacteria bacterium]|jgi:hypothetical protein|nr:hypothetical protein [Deltaproteobacteria bacterium]
MAVIVLSSNQAFNSGADLWVIPDFSNSAMAIQLDWYNNFLIGKTLRKKKLPLDSNLNAILNETELPRYENLPSPHDVIMIPSSKPFPNRWTVMVGYEQDSTLWSQKIFKLYLDLNKPSLRIFLPSNLSMNQFVESWRSFSSEEDLSIVLEN